MDRAVFKGLEAIKKTAVLTMTSGDRQEVYKRIFLLNRSFHFIVTRLEELAETKLFHARDLREMAGLAQEVQLQINTLLLNHLDSIENDDWAQFGKVRTALEKRLRMPLPERRKRKAKRRSPR